MGIQPLFYINVFLMHQGLLIHDAGAEIPY